jgi:hypothetical protein
MWFGILTPGRHDCRPTATPEATLYCWNDIARMRVDGPAADLASGLRMLRGTMRRRGQAPHEPRCFVCGTPYDIPDPALARADAQDWEPGHDGAPVGDGEAPPADVEPGGTAAMFALAHLEDGIDDVRDEEALLVIPAARLAMLVPVDAVSRLLDILARAPECVAPHRCACCDAIAPAGARVVNGQSRAERRATSRARRKADRGGGSHRRAA